MEQMSLATTLKNTYRFLYPSPTGLDVYEIKDRVLVYFSEIEEMQSNAGYWTKFKPIAGDYTKIFNQIIVTDSGFFGSLGYSAAARLASMDLTTEEKQFNEKITD